MLKTATIVGGGHRFRTFLNLLPSFFHLPVFWKRSFTTPCCSSCFHFCSCPLILRYIFLVNYLQARRHCYRKTTRPLSKLLLGKLRTNRERVILLSSQSKIKKKYSRLKRAVRETICTGACNTTKEDPVWKYKFADWFALFHYFMLYCWLNFAE